MVPEPAAASRPSQEGDGPADRGGAGGLSLRTRLLLGIGVAVVVPMLLFGILGVRELGRGSVRTMIESTLRARAAQAARDLDAVLRRNLDLATIVSASLFEGGEPLASDLDSWALRVAGRVSTLGRIWIVDAHGNELLRADGSGVLPREPGTRPPPEAWLRAVLDGGGARFLSAVPDPLARLAPVEGTRDPTRYVVPLGVPLRSDRMLERGVCFFLMPLSVVEQELAKAWDDLAARGGLEQGAAWLVDPAQGRFVVHRDRDRVGTAPGFAVEEGFVEEEDGRVRAVARLGGRLPWLVGVEGVRQEFFFASVDALRRFLWALVGLLLLTTLGMAAWQGLVSTRSLRSLELATEELGRGDLSARAAVAGPRETRKLARALNDMAAELEKDRERVRQAERDRAWTAMARQVAHEIKNPLQPMRLHGELIDRAREDPAVVGRSAKVILRQVEALTRIVQGFSAFAAAGDGGGEQRVRPVAEVLTTVRELFAVEGGVEVVDHTDGALHRGGEGRLEQVLVNLVRNAREAMPEGGAAPVEVEGRVEDGRVVLEVRDRGEGLPEGFPAEGFEPIDSRKPGGSGLGLAICQRNVEAMGGRLRLAPRPGGGAVARVELPLVPGAEADVDGPLAQD